MKNISLAVQGEKNFKLLKTFLIDEFNIKRITRENDFNSKTDLIIIDQFYLKNYEQRIKKINNHDNFIPILFIHGEDYCDFEYIMPLIDEFVEIPIAQRKLRFRIDNLLKLRDVIKEKQVKYNKLIENSHLGVCVLEQKKVINFNENFAKIFNNNNALMGKNFFDFVCDHHQASLKKQYNNFINNKSETDPIEIEVDINGQLKWLNIRMSKMPEDFHQMVLIIVLDVTENKKAIQKIDFMNKHDNLTGLYNRAYLDYQLKEMDCEENLPLTIIMGDIDGLKLINDGFGHNVGDEVLIEVSNIIKDSCRSNDKIFRVGGDEILILLPNTSYKMGNKVLKRIEASIEAIDKDYVSYSISLGASTKVISKQELQMVYSQAEDRMYQNKLTKSEGVRNSIIQSLEKALEEKTDETAEHALRMKKLTLKISERLDLDKNIQDELNLLTRLHDIGKVAIAENILRKPGKLDKHEWEDIKKHPAIGYRIVKSIPQLASVADAILYHHERWDGTGYPQGKEGKEIPLTSRIISIVDAFDVMTHERPYKEAYSHSEAIKEIKRCSATQFDPYLAQVFIDMIEEKDIKIKDKAQG